MAILGSAINLLHVYYEYEFLKGIYHGVNGFSTGLSCVLVPVLSKLWLISLLNESYECERHLRHH